MTPDIRYYHTRVSTVLVSKAVQDSPHQQYVSCFWYRNPWRRLRLRGGTGSDGTAWVQCSPSLLFLPVFAFVPSVLLAFCFSVRFLTISESCLTISRTEYAAVHCSEPQTLGWWEAY